MSTTEQEREYEGGAAETEIKREEYRERSDDAYQRKAHEPTAVKRDMTEK